MPSATGYQRLLTVTKWLPQLTRSGRVRIFDFRFSIGGGEFRRRIRTRSKWKILTGEEPRRRTQPGIAPWTEKPGKGFNRRKQSKQRQKGFFTEVRKGNKEWLTTDGADFTDGFTFLHRGRMDRIMLDRIISLIKEVGRRAAECSP